MKELNNYIIDNNLNSELKSKDEETGKEYMIVGEGEEGSESNDMFSMDEEMYEGEYSTDAAFAEDYYEKLGVDIHWALVIDWEATYESSLRFDYGSANDHYFCTSF